MSRRLLAVLAVWIALVPGESLAQGSGASPFPHDRHERLFPLCESCHLGMVNGNEAAEMPGEASCRECHNGTDAKVVTWRRPQRDRGLLNYSHVSHAREVPDSTGRACATCHASSGRTRMSVQRAQAPSCLTCHSHRASTHLGDDNRCATCHVALTAAVDLTAEHIAAFPKPASHERPDFVSAHRPPTPLNAASCATCHARESCARCHVNASTQPLIASLGRDARVARLVAGKPATYPVPADHRSADFDRVHGNIARDNADRCAACHARPSCTSCHIGSGGADVLARMPMAERGGAQGILLRLQPAQRRAPNPLIRTRQDTGSTSPKPVRVHDASFRTTHRAQASVSALSCAGCHDRSFCTDCHAGEAPRRFHAASFFQGHAADSYGRENECAACHNAQLFCLGCHQQSGLGARGRLDAAFHTAQPQWLLQHGRAARQGLQSCATCHAQRTCLTCHSTLGWGVNPHGPGFNAERLASRSATQCLMCHLQVPTRRR